MEIKHGKACCRVVECCVICDETDESLFDLIFLLLIPRCLPLARPIACLSVSPENAIIQRKYDRYG